MRLYLSDTWHLFSDLSNDDGEVVYRIQSSPKWWPKMSKISRRIEHPSLSRRSSSSSDGFEENSEGWGREGKLDDDEMGSGIRIEESVDFRNKFAHLASINYNVFSSTKIRLGGEEILTQQLFRKGAKGHFGKDRIFKGPDGEEYKWTLGPRIPELYRIYDNALVATVIRPQRGFFEKALPLTLEIAPCGEHMLDWIVITFVYIEKMRMERESS